MSEAEFSTFADGEDCPECRAANTIIAKLEGKLASLRAIVDQLPKCWGLRNGVLVQDVPVVPRMTVWKIKWPTTLGHLVREVSSVKRVRLGGHSSMFDGGQLANSREAAEAAGASNGKA